MLNELEVTPLLDEDNRYNLKLGRTLFSDPQRDKRNAIVVSNISDPEHEIKAGGLIKIDFTVNEIKFDGLYVITLNDGWIGYRRFQFMPDLKIVSEYHNEDITSELLKTIKVVGLIKEIYRSV